MNYHCERFRKLTFRALALCQSEDIILRLQVIPNFSERQICEQNTQVHARLRVHTSHCPHVMCPQVLCMLAYLLAHFILSELGTTCNPKKILIWYACACQISCTFSCKVERNLTVANQNKQELKMVLPY